MKKSDLMLLKSFFTYAFQQIHEYSFYEYTCAGL